MFVFDNHYYKLEWEKKLPKEEHLWKEATASEKVNISF